LLENRFPKLQAWARQQQTILKSQPINTLAQPPTSNSNTSSDQLLLHTLIVRIGNSTQQWTQLQHSVWDSCETRLFQCALASHMRYITSSAIAQLNVCLKFFIFLVSIFLSRIYFHGVKGRHWSTWATTHIHGCLDIQWKYNFSA